MYRMSGLCAQELQYKIDIEKALIFGFLPEPYLESDLKMAKKLMQSYSHGYLKEEIQAEALTRNLQGFIRFLNTMAENSGNILDFSKISTKSKVSRSSIIRFIEILEDTLIGYRLEVFDKSESADIIKHPKFYFFDTGVLNGIVDDFSPSKERRGILFEHLVLAQLYNSAAALDEKIEISYFRTRHGVEVDFIIKWRKKYYAIEVKSGEIAKHDLSGLKIFREYFPEIEKSFVISEKEKKRILDKVIICNVEELFKQLSM